LEEFMMKKTRFKASQAIFWMLGGAACAPLHAQSNVTIGGTLDIGVFRDNAGLTQVGSMSRSNLAFSGAEDLGGGMSAIFKLSTRMDLDRGTLEGAPSSGKPLWHGESTVGLKGGFGRLRVGRALDALGGNDWNFDPWYFFDNVASPAWDLWHYNFPSDPKANQLANGTLKADYGRLNNGVFYDSPDFGGFSVHLSGSPEKLDGDKNRPLGVSLNCGQGPWAAMLSQSKNSAGSTDTFVGLKGGAGSFSVMGAYDVSKDGPSDSKAKAWTLGAQYFMGPWTFNLGYGELDVDGLKVEKMAGLGALYNLSKRTYVYASLADKKFKPVAAESSTAYGLGINHSF
jgi:predicted porin